MLLRSLLRYNVTNLRVQRRPVSLLSSFESSPVLISSNNDIYTNLAIEHLLYNNLKFEDASSNVGDSRTLKKPVVFIWTDSPCVVIGRHQNPWIESCLGQIGNADIKLARRQSGGGCVYHDENNINISIIGHRNIFANRQENLKFLANFLEKSYGIKCQSTMRHDLVHKDSGLKLTGSAAKLGQTNCYHHFTLLVDTNKEALYTSIRQNQQDFIQTNSTSSIRSKVVNLKELKPNLDVQQVISDLAIAFGKLYMDPHSKHPARKDNLKGDHEESASIIRVRDEMQSWNWVYGMTPKFKLERVIPLIDRGAKKYVKFTVTINKGLFETIEIDSDLVGGNPADTFRILVGTKFSFNESMINISKLIRADQTEVSNIIISNETIFGMFLLQMVRDAYF